MTGYRYFLAGFLLLAVWGQAQAQADIRTHRYRVVVGPELDRLQIRVRLAEPVVALRSRDRDAQRYTEAIVACDGSGRPQIQGRRLRLNGATCIQYEFDLAAVPKPSRRSQYWQFQNNRQASPASWLWLPPLDPQTEIQVSFDLPAGVNVSVPWQPISDAVDNSYRFGASPSSSEAIAVFGDFSYREITVPGSVLRVTFLEGEVAHDQDVLARWLRAAAANVTRVYGRFPNPSPQIIVVPVTSFGNSAVPFGRVIRDGGEAVQFFVDPDRPLEDYLGDWTATHEFSHLLLPYVGSREKWISEGFASYYQNVLMARAGEYSETMAWQKLHDGFERARNERPASPNGARFSRSRMMIYWSGAAVALLADVALRQRAPDTSLDALLADLQACCLPSERTWDGPELFGKLDELGGTSVLMDLYQRHANRRGMPELDGLYRQLGITIRDNKVVLDDAAPLVHVRRAIMADATGQSAALVN